nr:hypothetical protein [Variovorax sp. E3]
MFLSNVSIGKRLTIVLGVILALFLATSVAAVYKLRQLSDEIDAMIQDNVKTERAAPTGCATPRPACSAPPPSPRAATPA